MQRYDREEVKRLHAEGLSASEITRKLGCNPKHCRYMLKQLGLSYNPRKEEDPFDEGKMMALHRAGWSIHKIADEMGVEDEEIRRRLNE